MLRKVLKWLPVLAVATSSALFAVTEAAQTSDEVAVSPRFASRQQNSQQGCAPTPPSCSVPCQLPPPVNRNINPSARGCPENMMGNAGVFITADFLWWKTQENDLMIGFNQTVADPTPDADIGSVLRHNPKWNPGFRVGLGFNPDYDGWDVYFNWTWYRNSNTRNYNVVAAGLPGATNQGIASFWLNDNENGIPSASSKLRLLLNMIDLELGRDYYVSCSLSLRPYAGVEGGWIDRNFQVSYDAPVAGSSVAPDAPGTYYGKTNYWGVGPRVGMNGDWRLYNSGFKIYGNFATAMLYGKVFKNFGIVNQIVDGSAVEALTANIVNTNRNWLAVPHLQMNVGLAWGSCLNCNKMFLGVRLGWEVNEYFNMPHFVYPSSAGEVASQYPINLSMQGLTLDVKFDF